MGANPGPSGRRAREVIRCGVDLANVIRLAYRVYVMLPTLWSEAAAGSFEMTSMDQSWVMRAACAEVEPDQLFGKGAEQRDARTLCFTCPVRMECLAEALDSESSFGVWGGLTERERRALLRRFPEVTDWGAWLRREDDELVAEIHARRAPRILTRVR